jgi:multimeric flavodoxin WrbA
MKAVILNGMRAGDSFTSSVQRRLTDLLEEKGWAVEPFPLHGLDVKPCGGCFGCWLQTPGRCLMSDTNEVAAAVTRCDLTVYLTPVTFGGYSSHLKKVVDHFIFFILPFFKTVDGETHHVPRFRQGAKLLVIGTMNEHDAESEAIFTSLAGRNAINLSPPRWSAGVLVEEQGLEAARDQMRDLLASVEVI